MDGAAADYRPLPHPLYPPPKLGASRSPLNPLVGPAFLLGRGGHGILPVDGYHADGGDDVPKCGARQARGGDGGLECGARRAAAGRDAGPVGPPPHSGGGPSRRRGVGDGRGQVGRRGDGGRSDRRGAR